jgi:hypothetical protein
MSINREIKSKELNGFSSGKEPFIDKYGVILRRADSESAAASILTENEKRKEAWRKEVDTPERAEKEKRFTDKVLATIECDSRVKETLLSVFDDKTIRREVQDRIRLGLSSCSRDKESADIWKMYILTYGRVSEHEKQQYENEIAKVIINDICCYANNIIKRYKRP